jgi:Carboxypeptidase regulatory-like domain
MSQKLIRGILLAAACLLVLPAAASAQSAIVGLVTDDSGGVLPGVTVEASSPALIEGSKTGITDGQGRYRIVQLRPGVYKLKFSLTGFADIVRDGINLPSEFTATVNAELKVGALAETVTVSGAAPQVDVQQATRTQVISRDVVDTLPISHNAMSLGVLAPGVRAGTPDVGGTQTTEQVGLRAHGLGGFDGEQMVEGMSIQSYEGTSQSFFDEGLQSEITVTTAAISADTAGGGIRLNSILKDGGNIFSGSAFMGGTRGVWVKNNIDDKIRTERHITSANGIDHIEYFNGSIGGPLKKDKLWWLLVARHQSNENTIANVPKYVVTPKGETLKVTNDLYIRDVGTRLTWQAAKNYKIGMFVERWWHQKGHSIGFGTDPLAGEQRDPRNAHHSIGNFKLTAPVTSRWLLEVGYSWAMFAWKGDNPTGSPAQLAENDLFSPAWYATAPTVDSALNKNFPDKCAYVTGCTAWNATRTQRQESQHNTAAASASYVTGSHNIKVGFSNQWGPGRQRKNTRNGHLQQNYVNNQPQTVSVYNNPIIQPSYVAYDLGVFAQDSWTLKRLTVNPGLRVQWIDTGMAETSMAAGRFAPARFYAEQKDLIKFGADYSPRLSAAYDLFGNGKTALKTSWARYYRNYDGDIAAGIYGNAGERSENRQWFDVDLVPGTANRSNIAKPTDNDGIAQDNEIGPSPSGGAFALKADRTPLNLKRQYNNEFTLGVQHQLLPRLSVGAMFYKRNVRNMAFIDRLNIGLEDYTSFTLPLPDVSRDPEVVAVLAKLPQTFTVYNLNSAKLSQFGVNVVDRSDTKNETLYTGFEASFNTRLPRGAVLFGSWDMDHTLQRFCDTNDDPNGPVVTGQFSATDATTGVSAPLGGIYCDQTKFPYPFRHEFKLAGNTPLLWGLDFGAILQSYAGQERVITWSPAAALFPNAARTQAETFVITPPGSLFYPRWNELDVNFKKNFRLNTKVLTFQIDIYNVFNVNTPRSENNAVGGNLGDATTIAIGRFPRLAVNYKF